MKPLTLFLVGATGDLAKRRIWKAIFQLYQLQHLPSGWRVVGIARGKYSQSEFREFVYGAVQPQAGSRWSEFIQHVEYHQGDVSLLETFTRLAIEHNSWATCGNHLWFVATLPSLYLPVVKHLRRSGLSQSPCGWSKLLLEKPFGTDLASARKLNAELAQTFTEEQIYRIDHFLAKETVQNVLVFRFANGIFEHLWCSEYIDRVEIRATETLGIAGREAFYDTTGVLRDVVQNHVLQMLATTLMEEPTSLTAEAIRKQRYEFLSKVTLADQEHPLKSVIFGQYERGVVNGAEAVGYHEEKGIPADSTTETAVSLKLAIHNKRWKGVPILITAGKRLDRGVTEITLYFKERRNRMFSRQHVAQSPNSLTFRIGPDESVTVRFSVKKPGLDLAVQEVPLQFFYKSEFQMELVEAYVKLLYDAVQGDSTLFSHAQDIEETWRIIDPLLRLEKSKRRKVFPYAAGATGPKEFGQL